MQNVTPLKPNQIDNLQEKQLEQLNPKIAEAVKAIQAKRLGKEPIAWANFSSHTKK